MENRNNNPIAEEIIHNNPTGYGLFAGIGDNFNSAAQAICELADDAISNLRANSDDPDLSMTIVVSFENLGDAVEIGVVDGGTGITNLDSALTIACRDGAQTPLNEHGFGLKHALASCDSSPSQQWSIRTRTKKDAAANQYREVTAPYSMGTSEEDQPMKVFFYPGAGGLPYPTGTAVTVRCPMAKFQTVKPDRKAAQSDFHHLVMYAIEELRYIYAGVLADTNITMKVLEVNGGTEKCHILKPLQPTWEEGTMKRLENVPYDLGGGQLTIHCRYGNILPTKSNAIYYKGNMASSGLEIRINGRCIERGLYSKVFGRALHPSCNRFLAQIDLRSEDGVAFPATETTKNAFVEGDARTQALFRWIRANVRQPETSRESLESRLVGKLAEKKAAESDTLRIGQFLFIKQRVHRHIDLRSETMGEVTQPDDLLLGNTRRRTRAETRCAHVQRIGTAQNSRTSLFIILGRG